MSNNISSRKNEAVRRFRLLTRERKFRESEHEFPAEGVRLCAEAADSGITITSVFITESALKRFPEAAEKLKTACPPDKFSVITDDIGEYISDTGTPQGVFVTAKIPDTKIDFGATKRERYILLDGLQDTGNIGTVIRSCDAFGINGAMLSKSCADLYSPKTVRSAMGSLFRLPAVTAELLPVIEALKERGFTVYAAMLDESAERLGSFVFPEKCAVIIGNEGNGVSPEVSAAASERLYIPINGAESLNAAVAASIISYELAK